MKQESNPHYNCQNSYHQYSQSEITPLFQKLRSNESNKPFVFKLLPKKTQNLPISESNGYKRICKKSSSISIDRPIEKSDYSLIHVKMNKKNMNVEKKSEVKTKLQECVNDILKQRANRYF